MYHEQYLGIALEEAEIAGREGSVPVGSVIVTPDGEVIARGRNRVLSEGDHTAHAETDAIRSARRRIAPTVPGDHPKGHSGPRIYPLHLSGTLPNVPGRHPLLPHQDRRLGWHLSHRRGTG